MPEAIKELICHLNQEQFSDEANDIIQVLYTNGSFTEEQKEKILLNPTETAAILSIRSGVPVQANYVKEISRERKNIDGTPRKRRLVHTRKVGSAYMYRLGHVLEVPPVRKMNKQTKSS